MIKPVPIRIVILTVYMFKTVIPELHYDHFYSGCNEKRYVNDKNNYRVEFHQKYTENCVLKFLAYPADRFSVCARFLSFGLPCGSKRRLILFFMKDKVSVPQEFDCQTTFPIQEFCGEFVYMYLRSDPYSKVPYTFNVSILLINVVAVPKPIVEKTNNSEENTWDKKFSVSSETSNKGTGIGIIIALASCGGVVVISVVIGLLISCRYKRRSNNNRAYRSNQNGHIGRQLATSDTTRPNIAYRWVASPNEYVQLEGYRHQPTEVIQRGNISNRDSAETVSLQSQSYNEPSVPSNDAVSSRQEIPGSASSQADYLNAENAEEQSPENVDTEYINTANLTTESLSDGGASRRSSEYYNIDQEDINTSNKSKQSTAYQTLWN